MQMVTRTLLRALPLAAVLGVAAAQPVPAAQGSQDSAAVSEKNAEAIREHIDEAEDIVERLLDWRHATSAVRTGESDDPPPTMPASTLISVEREQVERLVSLLGAAAATLPPATGAQSRGDLRAHVRQAQEIARELMPSARETPVGTSGTSAPAGTSSSAERMIEVDRTALQRLEIEIDAIEMIAPRRLQ